MQEQSEEVKEILKFVDNLVKENNKKEEIRKNKQQRELAKIEMYESYGIVVLDNGMIINIKNNFNILEVFWQAYVIYKEFGNKEQMDKLMKETNGGVFDGGDVLLKLEDIKLIMKPQEYYRMKEHRKEFFDMKNNLMFSYLENNVFLNELEDDDEEDDDVGLE